MREQARIRARRRKWYLQGSIAAIVLVGLAVAGFVVVNSVQPSGPGPKNMVSDGIVLTSTTAAVATPALAANEKPVPTTQDLKDGKAHITVYLDYQCPYCQEFEAANASQIGAWLDNGIATLEIHPIAMLDASSNGTKYSSRAANAAACVANYKPSVYFALNTALFKDQPKEGTSGLPNSRLISILKGVGATGSTIENCLNKDTFSAWVSATTTRALTKPLANSTEKSVSGTPTVIVNGVKYPGSVSDSTAFATFVNGIMTSGANSSTGTPAPTTTPTP